MAGANMLFSEPLIAHSNSESSYLFSTMGAYAVLALFHSGPSRNVGSEIKLN